MEGVLPRIRPQFVAYQDAIVQQLQRRYGSSDDSPGQYPEIAERLHYFMTDQWNQVVESAQQRLEAVRRSAAQEVAALGRFDHFGRFGDDEGYDLFHFETLSHGLIVSDLSARCPSARATHT